MAERRYLGWRDISANERKLHHPQQVEVIRIAKLTSFLTRLVDVAAQNCFAAGQYQMGQLGRRMSRQKSGRTLQKASRRLRGKNLVLPILRWHLLQNAASRECYVSVLVGE